MSGEGAQSELLVASTKQPFRRRVRAPVGQLSNNQNQICFCLQLQSTPARTRVHIYILEYVLECCNTPARLLLRRLDGGFVFGYGLAFTFAIFGLELIRRYVHVYIHTMVHVYHWYMPGYTRTLPTT